MLSCCARSSLFATVSSTTFFGAFSTKLGEDSLPSRVARSFSIFVACLLRREISCSASTRPARGMYTQKPSFTTVSMCSSELSASASPLSMIRRPSILHRNSRALASDATSALRPSSSMTSSAEIFLFTGTCCSARMFLIDLTASWNTAKDALAPLSASSSGRGQREFTMLSPDPASTWYTSSVTKGIYGCSRRRDERKTFSRTPMHLLASSLSSLYSLVFATSRYQSAN